MGCGLPDMRQGDLDLAGPRSDGSHAESERVAAARARAVQRGESQRTPAATFVAATASLAMNAMIPERQMSVTGKPTCIQRLPG